MAGREVLGRQTSPGGRPQQHGSGAPNRLLGESPTPTGLRRPPSRSVLPANIPLPVRPSSAPSITIDGDDDAETRLYRPRADQTFSLRGSSGPGASSDRPSRGGIAMISRPGALIAIPADVPSVRMRFDSEVELKDSSFSQPALVMPVQPRQRSSMAMRMLVVALAVTVLALTAHEIAALFHLPWLDPRNVVKSLAIFRHKL